MELILIALAGLAAVAATAALSGEREVRRPVRVKVEDRRRR